MLQLNDDQTVAYDSLHASMQTYTDTKSTQITICVLYSESKNRERTQAEKGEMIHVIARTSFSEDSIHMYKIQTTCRPQDTLALESKVT